MNQSPGASKFALELALKTPVSNTLAHQRAYQKKRAARCGVIGSYQAHWDVLQKMYFNEWVEYKREKMAGSNMTPEMLHTVNWEPNELLTH